MPEERRILDAVWGLTLLLFLVVVGIGLVIVVGLTPLATATPAVLLGPKSDIANAFGLVVDNAAHPVILPFPMELGMLGLGLFVSEAIRARWGLKIGGLIVLPLLVLFAFRNEWLLALYLLAAVSAFVGIRAVHWWTLVYGRVLLSMAVIFGLLTVISVVPAIPFPFENGLLPFFSGVLGGVGAYNIHTVAPAERRASVLIGAGVFVGLAAIARVVLTPLPEGILVQVGGVHVVGGLLILTLAVREAYALEAIRPGEFERVPSLWEADYVRPGDRVP